MYYRLLLLLRIFKYLRADVFFFFFSIIIIKKMGVIFSGVFFFRYIERTQNYIITEELFLLILFVLVHFL